MFVALSFDGVFFFGESKVAKQELELFDWIKELIQCYKEEQLPFTSGDLETAKEYFNNKQSPYSTFLSIVH
ncbi:hypothetical protein ACEVN9_002742 [Acinetobacter baumannii]